VNYLVFEAFFIPSAAVAGQCLARFGVYRPIHFVGFFLLTLGPGLNILLTSTTTTAVWAVLVALNAIGLGIMISTVLPAVLSSLAESDVAVATGMYSFLRSFGFIWGATIPGRIFNASFDRHIGIIEDAGVRQLMSHGDAYQFASGPYIRTLSTKLQAQVVEVYVKALRVGWEAAIAFGCFGLLLVYVQKHHDLDRIHKTEFGIEKGPSTDEVKN